MAEVRYIGCQSHEGVRQTSQAGSRGPVCSGVSWGISRCQSAGHMYLQSGVRSVPVKLRTKSDCETWTKNARSYCHARLRIFRKISALCSLLCVGMARCWWTKVCYVRRRRERVQVFERGGSSYMYSYRVRYRY